ncbi:poly(glycerol-phosphate) alpha-glucosyltransferase [Lentilactobacillus fungorum]|uniref:Poly(Glycerol-phosphate) alpha-glucosyltransferase n=1 Tax=Lentilactobacillus fungorum TaxID=2201250 RepID=A0ABQ3VYW3_9LACO|nr:hypothetical protein [Lentilactobacillus fungorum]GHP13412.1 poly(glycerol-phosphate) alpha-glucosyltransferase [Lentilactobacillus fungorum]
MIYLLADSLGEDNIEVNNNLKQQLRVFKTYDKPVKIVTRDYDRFQSQRCEQLGIDEADVINLFDYFQGTVKVAHKKPTIHDLPQISKRAYEIQPHGPNYQELRDGGRLIAHVQIMPTTVGQVNYIQYFDEFGNISLTQNYDWRGFKSSEDYLHPDGNLAYTFWFNQAGQRVLQLIHMYNADKQVVPTSYHLENYQANHYLFGSLDDLFSFFLDELIKNDDQATLIVNNPENLATSVRHLTGHPRVFLRYQHLFDPQQVITDSTNAQITDTIVATSSQATVLREHSDQVLPTVIADMSLSDTELHAEYTPIVKRQHNDIVAFTDFTDELSFANILKAWHLVRKTIPDAKLTLCSKPDSRVDLVAVFKKINAEQFQKIVNVVIDQNGIDKAVSTSKLILYLSKFAATPTTLLYNFKDRIPARATLSSELAPVISDLGLGKPISSNAEGIAEAVIDLLQNEPAQQAAVQAIETARTQLTIDRYWQAWQKVLD